MNLLAQVAPQLLDQTRLTGAQTEGLGAAGLCVVGIALMGGWFVVQMVLAWWRDRHGTGE